jgi:hypothetical protein
VTDKPTDDTGDDEGPIKPEVVGSGRGAAARKRRPGGEPVPVPGDAAGDVTEDVPPRRGGTIFRMGCILLVALGVMELFIASQLVLDPDEARCSAARFRIDAANDDDEDFNDVDLPEGIDDVDDLECVDAIALAGDIPSDEDDEPDGTFPEASSFRTQGLVVGALGLAHGITGFLTLRTRRRAFRTTALIFAAAGILLPVLGIISLLLLAFVVFALAFSRDAKELFGGGSGFFRPRVPPAS